EQIAHVRVRQPHVADGIVVGEFVMNPEGVTFDRGDSVGYVLRLVEQRAACEPDLAVFCDRHGADVYGIALEGWAEDRAIPGTIAVVLIAVGGVRGRPLVPVARR